MFKSVMQVTTNKTHFLPNVRRSIRLWILILISFNGLHYVVTEWQFKTLTIKFLNIIKNDSLRADSIIITFLRTITWLVFPSNFKLYHRTPKKRNPPCHFTEFTSISLIPLHQEVNNEQKQYSYNRKQIKIILDS